MHGDGAVGSSVPEMSFDCAKRGNVHNSAEGNDQWVTTFELFEQFSDSKRPETSVLSGTKADAACFMGRNGPRLRKRA